MSEALKKVKEVENEFVGMVQALDGLHDKIGDADHIKKTAEHFTNYYLGMDDDSRCKLVIEKTIVVANLKNNIEKVGMYSTDDVNNIVVARTNIDDLPGLMVNYQAIYGTALFSKLINENPKLISVLMCGYCATYKNLDEKELSLSEKTEIESIEYDYDKSLVKQARSSMMNEASKSKAKQLKLAI